MSWKSAYDIIYLYMNVYCLFTAVFAQSHKFDGFLLLFQFSVFLLIIFIAELAVGTAAYLKHQDLETSVVKSLNESLKQYPTNPDIKKNFDIIQTDVS